TPNRGPSPPLPETAAPRGKSGLKEVAPRPVQTTTGGNTSLAAGGWRPVRRAREKYRGNRRARQTARSREAAPRARALSLDPLVDVQPFRIASTAHGVVEPARKHRVLSGIRLGLRFNSQA